MGFKPIQAICLLVILNQVGANKGMVFPVEQTINLEPPRKFIILRIFDRQTQNTATQKINLFYAADISPFNIRFRIDFYLVIRDGQIRFVIDMVNPEQKLR